jgi:hypothetical protein
MSLGRRHWCPGFDCSVCERKAEDRTARSFDSNSEEEHRIRQAERRYEAQILGRGL